MAEHHPVTAQKRYTRLQTERNPYLERAREAARLTLPSLMPDEGETGGAEQYQPFQSTGARGVNHLSAKLMLALFPPGHPWFRLTIPDHVLEEAMDAQGASGIEDAKGEFEGTLARVERTVLTRGEHRGHRATLTECQRSR